MQTKLTLRLDEELIAAMKIYAKERGKSLSQIVADYFHGFIILEREKQDNANSSVDEELYPITKSLIGAWKRDDDEQEPDYREEYRQYLEEKHS